MNNNLGKNITVLDSLRAFAALSVCLFHFICTTTGFVKTESILSAFSTGKYGVQMFFVISGFVIPWSMYQSEYKLKNFFSFILKRLSRLEPPYLFSILLALLLLFFREILYGKENGHIEISIKQVFLHLGYLIPFFQNFKWLNPVYWTLAIEFQYYFLMVFLFIALVKGGVHLRNLALVALLISSFFTSETYLLYWLPVFSLGMILFLYKSRITNKIEFYTSLLVVLSLCFYKYPFSSVLFAIIPLVFVLFFQDLKIMGLHIIGKFSYSIYLLHTLVGGTIINVLSHQFSGIYAKIGVVLLGLLLTLLSAYFMYVVIERPSKKFSASIKYEEETESLELKEQFENNITQS